MPFRKSLYRSLFTVLLSLGLPESTWAQEQPAPITRSRDLQLGAEEYRAIFQSFTPEERQRLLQDEHALEDFLSDFHAATVLANRARAEKLDQDPEVQAKIEVKTRSILANEVRVRYLEHLSFPDFRESAREYYLAHREDLFTAPEMVKVAHILIKPDPCTWKQKGREAALAEAEAKAEALRTRIQEGEDFGQLAREYSEDPASAARGGVIDRWAKRGTFVAPFEKAAFTLRKPGDLSPVIETIHGFHIIQLVGHRDPQVIPFEKVKGRILKTLKKNYRAEKAQEYLGPTYADPRYIDFDQARAILRQLDAHENQTKPITHRTSTP